MYSDNYILSPIFFSNKSFVEIFELVYYMLPITIYIAIYARYKSKN